MSAAPWQSSEGRLALWQSLYNTFPLRRSYRFGSTYLRYLGNVLPNVTGVLDPDENPLTLVKQSGSLTAALPKLSPSQWAAVRILGVTEAFHENKGVGFSGVAEPYMNFGYPGVLLFFLALGLVLARMECSNLLLNYRWLCVATFLYWFFIMTVRNEFGVFTKPASFLSSPLAIWVVVRRFTPFARP